ncbi:hypothetical protein Ahu01nite_074960 [Winogradskya humida]|uniref:Uncharacterized protein n=1 Tax=Winogradskya humida TaxID=113566 RepID=A0ABQ4A0N0_9ACTN|nr:hypothetical protein Ahu01nite_074960 [Actinoplanes humidus]
MGSEGFPSPGGRGGSVMGNTVGPRVDRGEGNTQVGSENRHSAKQRSTYRSIIARIATAT